MATTLFVLSILVSLLPSASAWDLWSPAQAEIPLVPPRVPQKESKSFYGEHEFVSDDDNDFYTISRI